MLLPFSQIKGPAFALTYSTEETRGCVVRGTVSLSLILLSTHVDVLLEGQ